MALKHFNIDGKIKRDLSKPLDKKLIKTRKSAGTQLSYISGNTCIDILNKTFGFAWSFEIIDSQIIEADDQIIRQSEWNGQKSWPKGVRPAPDKTQTDGKGLQYIVMDKQGSIAWVHGKLTVPFTDEYGNIVYISKSAYGSQLITGPGQTQSMTGLKAAGTDALKKAATLFGVALELYRDENEEAYFLENNADIFNIWTDEVKEEYAEQLKYIDAICQTNDYTYDDLAYWIQIASGGTASEFSKMEPEYLDALVYELKTDEDVVQPETEEAK